MKLILILSIFLFVLAVAEMVIYKPAMEHQITELTARADSLQAECDSLHKLIDTNPRYMKGLIWYWEADSPFIIYHNDCNPETLWTKLKEPR